MRYKRKGVLTTLIVLILMLSVPVTATAQHGGSLNNAGNELWVVQGEAENDAGLEPGYGFVEVRELIHFSNDDPAKEPDYAIVYIPPSFTVEPTYPRVRAYRWDFDVVSYNVTLSNVSDDFIWNISGVTGDQLTIQPGDLNSDGPGAEHPMVNATYTWAVAVIDVRGKPIMTFEGGEVTTLHDAPTVIDLGPLDLPPTGPNTHEADGLELLDLTLAAVLEDHPDLKEGFYRFRIAGMTFEQGVNMTIEVRYTGELSGGRARIDKLLFTQRPVQMEVFTDGDHEVLAYSIIGDTQVAISPTQRSTGRGEPTIFKTDSSFALVLREKGGEGTDWDTIGRYAIIGILIVALLALLLWTPGRKREAGGEDTDDEGEGVEPEPSERDRLEERKRELMEQIKELDDRHQEGTLGEASWKRKRAALKEQTVAVMKELEELED